MPTVQLKYKDSHVEVAIPNKNLYAVLNPGDLPGVIDPFREVREALDNPIESISLKEMAKDKKNVVIRAATSRDLRRRISWFPL
ncbi:DUF2088 domain-containing protein [Thermoanaerobacteraceae bacterium SP2]|nr:DUF2088 domain-containing protein [Thermoanaerobacteraceae bacterium SP2]